MRLVSVKNKVSALISLVATEDVVELAGLRRTTGRIPCVAVVFMEGRRETRVTQ